MKVITAFIGLLLLGLASASAVSAARFPSVHIQHSEQSCPAPGDSRDCTFYREAAAIASESLALAAYGTKNVSSKKAMRLERRLCKLVDEYGLPKPEVCEVDRMMVESVERINWPKLIRAICDAIAAILE